MPNTPVRNPLEIAVDIAAAKAVSMVNARSPESLSSVGAEAPTSYTRAGDDGSGGIVTIAPFTIGASIIGGTDAIFAG